MGNRATGRLTKVFYTEDAGTTWVQVGCFVNFQPPGDEDDLTDMTCLSDDDTVTVPGDAQQSTAEGQLTFIVGDGTVAPVGGVQPDPDQFMKDAYDTKTVYGWKVTNPNWDREYGWTGRCFRYKPDSITRGDRMTAAVGLTREGAITRTAPP